MVPGFHIEVEKYCVPWIKTAEQFFNTLLQERVERPAATIIDHIRVHLRGKKENDMLSELQFSWTGIKKLAFNVLSESWETASLGYPAHTCVSSLCKTLLGSFGSLVIINTGPLPCIRAFLHASKPLVIPTPLTLNLSLPYPSLL